jgi:hypothetical protein
MVFGSSLAVKVAIASTGIALPAEAAGEKVASAKGATAANAGIGWIDIIRIARHKYGGKGEAGKFGGIEPDGTVDEAVCA